MANETRVASRQLKDIFLKAPDTISGGNLPMFELDDDPKTVDSGIPADRIMLGPNTSVSGNILLFDDNNGTEVIDGGINGSDLCVRYTVTSTANNVVSFASSDGKTLKDSGRDARRIIEGPTSSINGNILIFNGTTGNAASDSGVNIDNVCIGPSSSIAGRIAIFNTSNGNSLDDSGLSISDIADAIHTHSAEDIISGTISGSRGVASGSSQTSFIAYNGHSPAAGKFDGGSTVPSGTTRMNYNGYLYATRVYNAVYNDYADSFNLKAGLNSHDMFYKIMAIDNNEKAIPADENSETVLGVASNMYAFIAGASNDDIEDNRKIPISIAGFVNVKIHEEFLDDCKRGKFVVPYRDGFGKPILKNEFSNYIGKIVGEIIRLNNDGTCMIKVMNL